MLRFILTVALITSSVPAPAVGAAGKDDDQDRRIEHLIQELGSSSDEDADAAKETLAKIGKPAVRGLAKVLKDGSSKQRTYAGKALRKIGRNASDAIPELLEALKDKNSDVRKRAAETLAAMDTEIDRILPALREVAKHDRNKECREAAAQAIPNLSRAQQQVELQKLEAERDAKLKAEQEEMAKKQQMERQENAQREEAKRAEIAKLQEAERKAGQKEREALLSLFEKDYPTFSSAAPANGSNPNDPLGGFQGLSWGWGGEDLKKRTLPFPPSGSRCTLRHLVEPKGSLSAVLVYSGSSIGKVELAFDNKTVNLSRSAVCELLSGADSKWALTANTTTTDRLVIGDQLFDVIRADSNPFDAVDAFSSRLSPIGLKQSLQLFGSSKDSEVVHEERTLLFTSGQLHHVLRTFDFKKDSSEFSKILLTQLQVDYGKSYLIGNSENKVLAWESGTGVAFVVFSGTVRNDGAVVAPEPQATVPAANEETTTDTKDNFPRSLKVGDVEWTLFDARRESQVTLNRYHVIAPETDAAEIIYISAQLINHGNDEIQTLGVLKLVDAAGRRYGEKFTDLSFASLNPNTPQPFIACFECPKGLRGLKLEVYEAGEFFSRKASQYIPLNLDPVVKQVVKVEEPQATASQPPRDTEPQMVSNVWDVIDSSREVRVTRIFYASKAFANVKVQDLQQQRKEKEEVVRKLLEGTD